MDILNECLDLCEQPISSPHDYISSITPKSSDLKYAVARVAKIMSSRLGAGNDRKNEIPGEMFIHDFENEQIWQQTELRNNLKSYIPSLNKILVSKKEVCLPYVKKSNLPDSSSSVTNTNEAPQSDSVILNESTSEDEESCDEENNVTGNSENSEKEDALASVNHDDSLLNREASSKDDMLFNLKQMESFLDEAEKETEEDAAQHGDIDYFSDMASDDEDLSQPMYNDFFGDVADNNKQMLEENEEEDEDLSEDEESDEVTTSPKKHTKKDNGNQDKLQSSKKVRFMSEDEETSDDDTEIHEKSSFEKKDYRLKEQIAKMEEKALSDKPWPQRGEVDAQGRPLNSLLEEIVDVDLASRPAPMMTEMVSKDLETIIKTRIKDKAFDDVERKIKPVHVQRELKKELVLNQEKSKLSLAQIYEQEYLSKQDVTNNQETVENNEMTEEKEEILKMMKAVFKKLDTLSNFHYTPKPVLDELKIISNAPAISVEEALPTAMSEGSTLAPQEIAGSKKKVLIGKDERSKTDKLRERRKKKAFLSNKFKKSKDQSSPITKILKSKNVGLMETTGKDKEFKTSTKFFQQLQDNADSGFLTKKPKEMPAKRKPHK